MRRGWSRVLWVLWLGGLAGLAGCDWPLDVRLELHRTVIQPGDPIEGTILLKNRAAHRDPPRHGV